MATMKEKCFSCEKIVEIVETKEGREINGKKFKIPLCSQCSTDAESNA